MCTPADKSVELDVSDDVRYNVGLADAANKALLAEQCHRLLGGEPGTD